MSFTSLTSWWNPPTDLRYGVNFQRLRLLYWMLTFFMFVTWTAAVVAAVIGSVSPSHNGWYWVGIAALLAAKAIFFSASRWVCRQVYQPAPVSTPRR